VVLIAGGVSKGKFDFLPRVLDELGVKKLFQGVAQRPGGPFWFGLSPRQTPVFALPGNPASAYICLHRYVLPALARMADLPPAAPRFAMLTESVQRPPELTGFLAVRTTQGPLGENLARPAPLNTSGILPVSPGPAVLSSYRPASGISLRVRGSGSGRGPSPEISQ